MKQIITHPILGEVEFSSTRRARRIILTVKPSGALRVSYPPRVSSKRALEFLNERIDWVISARERMAKRCSEHPVLTFTDSEIESMRSEAKRQLPQRVELLARHFGFSYGRITIRSSRSKWACCTSRNNLSLSLYMMMLPEHLRDFILLHELCHTRHHNHSKEFHALLDSCLGGRERELISELKKYHIR